MDNTLDPQILDELNKLPSWARQEAIRRLRGEDTRTASDKLLGDAFKGVSKAADVLNKAPIVDAPAGGLVYLSNLLRGQSPEQASSGQGIRAEDPKKFVQPQAAKVPVIGKELSGAAGAVLDPATIVGAGLVGPGLLANVGGRGTMGLGAYLGLNAAGGAGAVGAGEAAKAVGNPDVGLGIHLATPAALAGGFLGATGASIASARIEGNAAIRNAGEAVVGDGGSLKNRAFNFADEIKQEDPFQIYKVAANAEGKPSYVMDRASLEQRIQGRKAAAGLKNPDGSSKIPGGDIDQWNQDTAHLENLASYMHNTGRQDLTLVDPWATAHSLGSAQESLGQRANWATRASQAQAIVDERAGVIGPEPDLRYTKSQQNAFQMLRGDIPPELDAKLLEGKALRDQVAQSGQSIAQAEQAVKDARQGFKDYTTQLKTNLPKGANTAASKYISALIGGDQTRVAEAADLLSRRGVNLSGPKPTHEMSYGEIGQAAQKASYEEKNATKLVFGDMAPQYEMAQRIANSTGGVSREQQQAADALIEQMESGLNDEGKRILFGIGETGPNAGELNSLHRSLGSLNWDSPQALGQSLSNDIIKIRPGVDPSTLSGAELESYMRIKHAFTEASAAGWNTSEVSQAAIESAAGKFQDPNDAAYMLQDYLQPDQARLASGQVQHSQHKPLPIFQKAVDLHSAHGQAEATRDALKQSHQALTDSLKSNQQSSEELAKSVFKNANSMKNKLFQTGNSKSLYRLGSKGLVTDEKGQILANLEQVTPSSSVKEAVGSNAALQAEDAAKVSEAQGQLNDLLAQRKAARATGDKVAIEGLRTQINDAKVNIDRLKTPSRPVPKEMLPPSPGRMIVPLKDLANFNVLEPNTFNPAALTKDGIRDGRTVSLLNDHARIKSETDQLSSQIKKTQTDLSDLQSKVQPTENEKVLLSQGVIDGVRPEIVQGYQSMARLNEERQMLSAALDQKQTEFGAVEDRLSRSQQGLEATLQQAETDRDFANEQLLKHNADYEKHMTDFEASLSLGDPSTIATRNLQNFKDSHQAVMDSITGKLSNKRVTEAAFQAELDNAEKLTQSRYMDLPREFASQHQDWVNRQANALSDMGAQAGFKRLHTPYTTAETNLDPMAMRSGIGGFLRRSLMGTGLPSARMEGWGAEFMNGRVRATTMAKMSYEAAKQNIAEIADLHLGELANGSNETAAWARTLRSEKDPAQRLQQYMAHAVKPMDDPAWKKALGPAAEHATPEELKALYDQASDSFLMLTAHPGLVDWKKTSLEFGTQARDWGQRVNEVRDLAGGRKIVPSMVKPEFRENLPTGRLQPILGSGGEAVNIADKDRNWATDMLEIIRNEQYSKKNRGLWRVANQQLSGISNTASIPLQDMLIPKHMWEETMAANTLASINKDAAYSSLANELKDPKQIAKIKQDGDLNANEWKDPEVAQSWGKMKGWLREDTPEGIWKDIEQVRRGAQKVASSLIFGDLGFMGNQALTGMAISPAESSRIIAHAKAGSLTDHGFMMAMQDNYDLIQHLSDKGVNLFGSSGVRGGSSAGNLLEMVPGLRIGGKALGKLDALTFERMQPLMFLDLYKASQAQLQNVRAFGRTPFTESLVDGVPGLASLHSKQDIWQSSSEELDNALLRNLENQMGNIRDSSLLLGANRKKLESTLLFVPGYFRAKAGVYTQAARALRDPSSPEGWLAASLLAREAAFRIGFGATIAASSGQFDGYMRDIGDMTAFDPRNSGGPLAGPLGDGGHLGLSWGNAAPKLYTQMLLGQKSGTANLNPGERLSAVKDFFDGRTNPVIRGMVEQYEGKDFMGRAVKTPGQRAEALAQNVLPIWIGQGLQTGTDQLAKDGKINPLAVAAESGAQFINLNYKDNAPYDVLNNRFVAWQAQKFPGQPTADYRNAPSDLRRMAKEQDPAVAEAERSWTYDRSRRSDPKSLQTDMAFKDFDHFNSQKDQNVAEATARVQAGKMDLATWKEVYSSAQEDRADNADQLRQRLSDLGIDLTKSSNDKSATLGGKAPDVALALAEYRSVKPQDYLKSNPDGTPITRFTDAGPVLDQDIDWTKYQAAKDATLAKYSPDVQSQIKTWLEPDDPIAKQLTHARAAMDTYFSDVPKYQGLSVEQGNYIDMYMSGMRAFAGQLADAGAKVDPQLAYSTALKQMAQQGHIQTPEQVKLAMMAQNMLSNSKLQLQARNPASLQFLIDNPDMIRFYPWLKSELPSKLDPLLPSDLRRTADYNAIASRELRQ